MVSNGKKSELVHPATGSIPAERLDGILKQMEDHTSRQRAYADQARQDLRLAMYCRKITMELLEGFLSEKSAVEREVILARAKMRAEKEVGPWFWRQRKDVSIEDDLRARAHQLKELGYNLDWQWDLLSELMTDWTGEADETLLREIIKEAHGASAY